MNKYELMLILNSSISEEDRNHSLEELRNLLTKNEVKIEKEDKELSKSINLNKAIIRYMFAKLES